MKKYKASLWWRGEINEVEVDRETDQFVVINGRMDAKLTSFTGYFDTYKEAYDFIINTFANDIELTKNRLDSQKKYLESFISKYPKPETV